jgi:hypothetical protein
MAYIGTKPTVGNFQICDAISVVNGQAAYTMQVGGVNVNPQSANHMIVSLNGTIQKPNSSYTVNSSVITFSSNLVTNDVIDFIQILGDVLDLGVPSDGTVTTAKVVDGAITSAKLASGVGGVAGITSSADATAITIDSSERVGINETSPTEKLDVDGNINLTDSLLIDGAVKFLAVKSSSQGNESIYKPANYSLGFNTNGGETMRLTDGKARLLHGDYSATPSSSNKGFEFRANGSTGGTLDCAITSTSNHTIINFDNGNGGVGTIQMNGSATAYNTSSDYRLKENVNYDFDATSRLKKLKPARFNFKADADTTVDGFIAHEVSSVVPEAISGEKDAVKIWKEGEELPEGVSVGDNKLDENGNTIIETQGIDQSKLVPLLVKTIQELEARITELENA